MFARNLLRRNVRLATMVAAGGLTGYVATKRENVSVSDIFQSSFVVPTEMTPIATSSSDERLPIYTREEVSKHTTPETRIWVTFKDGVYDITEFVQAHPGGAQRIMLAAGGQVDPFWLLYQQHYTENVQKLLAPMRIGTLAKDDIPDPNELDTADPYAAEPKRHPALVVRKQKPFNCETPVSLIPDQYITPTALWYCRHHHPVPLVNPEEFTLRVEGEGLRSTDFTLKQLREKFPAHKVTMTQQCAGNRRSELHKVRPTQGLLWAQGTISTGEFVGVRVRDVVESCLLNKDDKESVDKALAKIGAQHVHFVAIDEPYDASIPMRKALSEGGDVILAYEMNGEELPREHGYPLRAVVPGVLGARNVKWVKRVVVSDEEAHSTWQRGVAYKGFPSNVTSWNNVDPSKYASVQELPVQSAICQPASGSKLDVSEETIEVSGYAWSGGGRGIVRVDVSSDGGETWHTAELGRGKEQPTDKAWAWTLWTAEVPVHPCRDAKVELVCKATDSSHNQQPESPESVWNLRGILNNSWHRVRLDIVEEDED